MFPVNGTEDGAKRKGKEPKGGQGKRRPEGRVKVIFGFRRELGGK